MTLDTDFATLREQLRHLGPWRGAVGDEALDRVETELARLREHEQEAKNLGYEGMRLRAETAERELVRLQALDRVETELARLRQEREGYKRDFLAASERCGIAEKERDRLQLILADINPRSGLDERTAGA